MNSSDSFEVKSSELPKIYKRTFSDLIDPRYYSTLFASLGLHILVVMYFLINPLPADDGGRIAKMQAQLAKTLKERELQAKFRTAKFEFAERQAEEPVDELQEEPPAPEPDKPEPEKQAQAQKTESDAERTARERAARVAERAKRRARARQSSNKELAASMGSKGLLGLLTSSSSTAQGGAVEDILGSSSKPKKDLDEALSNLSGISVGGPKRTGSGDGNGTVKGGRSTGGAGIDDLVTGLGDAESGSVERTGDLVVVAGSSSVEGSGNGSMAGRTASDVEGVVLNHNSSIQYCYERELRRNPSLKGKVVVRFTITPQGTVKTVDIVSSTMNSRKVEQCIVSRIRRWDDFGPIDPKYGDTTIRQVYAFGY